MRKLLICSLLIFALGLGHAKDFSNNLCASQESIEEIKFTVSLYSWYSSRPLEAIFELYAVFLALTFSEESREKVEEWVLSRFGETVNRVNIVEISEPEKSDKRLYRCSAVAELDSKRYVVVYTMEKIHTGKEDYYRMQISEVFEVK